MTWTAFSGALLLGLVLLGLPQRSQADTSKDTAQKTAKSKGAKRLPRKKMRSKHGVTRNLLHPFTLRLLYTPSYRFLSKYMRDRVEEIKDAKESKVQIEIAQFLPISVGLEGEFAFNQWVSLAVGGSFTWQDEFVTLEHNSDAVKNGGGAQQWSGKFYEYVVGSSLYGNVFNYFKLGVGAELAFKNLDSQQSLTEKGKKYEYRGEMTWKRASARLALRRDFFLSRVGFGVGFNASLPLGKMFDRQEEHKRFIDGKLQKPEPEGESDSSDNGDDFEDEGIYSVTLMPMIYVAF